MPEQSNADRKAADARRTARHARDVDAAEQIRKLGRLIGLGRKDRS